MTADKCSPIVNIVQEISKDLQHNHKKLKVRANKNKNTVFFHQVEFKNKKIETDVKLDLKKR